MPDILTEPSSQREEGYHFRWEIEVDFLDPAAPPFNSWRMSNRRHSIARTILWAIPLLLFTLWLCGAGPSQSIAISSVDDVERLLVLEGFKVDERVMMVDEIALGPLNPMKKWILSRVIPTYQTRSTNRRYSRNGSKLGIDFGIRDDQAIGVTVTCDPDLISRARAVAYTLGKSNPSAPILIRINSPRVTATNAPLTSPSSQ